jgi:uncharacterized protein YbaR (Trm112 family)
MNKKIMNIICCPVCKNDLELNSVNQDLNEIIEGDLYCKNCDFHYPINDGIPNLLPPEYHTRSDEERNNE